MSDYIIKKGIIINIQDIDTKYQSYIKNGTTGIPILTVNKDFFPSSGEDSGWERPTQINPAPELLNDFHRDILDEIKTATKKKFVRPNLKVDFNYTYNDGNHVNNYLELCNLDDSNKTSFIHFNDLLPKLREPKNKLKMNVDFRDIYKEFVENGNEDKYSDDFFQLLLEDDIEVDDKLEGDMIDIKDISQFSTLNSLLQAIYSYTVKVGTARDLINIRASAEIEYFNKYNIDDPYSNYIVGNLREYIDFSPTAEYYSRYTNEKKICVCYGSYIIPYGNLGQTKYTEISNKRLSDKRLYSDFPNGLQIEIEHIAHFLQMLFFGGSKYETCENLLGDLKE